MQTAGSGWQICAQMHDRLGESVLWHPEEEALYWIDFYGPSVHRKQWNGGPVETWQIDRSGTIGSFVFADEGRLILAVDHGLHLFDTKTGTRRFFADPKGARMDLVYNDGKVDRAGRYWVGTYEVTESKPHGVFYRVEADGTATVADQGFTICNGPAFSPDNRKLYFSDTVGCRILSYELNHDGSLSGRQTFFSISEGDGMPDGLTVDSQGNVWCALYGGAKVICIDPNGALKQSLAVPAAYVTSLCFGGPELRTLYVATGWSNGTTEASRTADVGGGVFMRPADVAGLPEPIISL